MDTLAHGLWGGAAFGQKEKSHFKWAFLLGMCPDLFSFGPFILTHLPTIIQRWGSRQRMEPPDPATIPAYVYHAYNVTHSLVVWCVVFAILYAGSAVRRNGVSANNQAVTPTRRYADPLHVLWPFFAWPLHILCDIPTHSTRFFPTPYLWPFHTPFVNGWSWGRSSFQLINYTLIALTYVALFLLKSKPKKSGPK